MGRDLLVGDASAAQADYAQIQQQLTHARHHSTKYSEKGNGSSLLHLLSSTASAAAAAYGTAGLSTLNAGSSLLSALA